MIEFFKKAIRTAKQNREHRQNVKRFKELCGEIDALIAKQPRPLEQNSGFEMNIISINFNIEGVADYYVGLLQGNEFHLVEQDVGALLMLPKQCDQLIQAVQLLKLQGKFDPSKVADYSAVFETAGLPPYVLETLMDHIESTTAMGENPQVQFIVHEVMMVPGKVVNY